MKRLILIIPVLIAGCSITGFSGGSKFKCEMPDGTRCQSVTTTLNQARNGELNNAPTKEQVEVKEAPTDMGTIPIRLTSTVPATTAIRTVPRELRIWIAPFEDTDGDLNDEQRIYMTIDSGRWLIEHSRRTIKDRYKPVRGIAANPSPAETATSAPQLNMGMSRGSGQPVQPFRPASIAMPNGANSSEAMEQIMVEQMMDQ